MDVHFSHANDEKMVYYKKLIWITNRKASDTEDCRIVHYEVYGNCIAKVAVEVPFESMALKTEPIISQTQLSYLPASEL